MNPAELQRIKELLPTTLGSDDIRDQIAADILRRSVFSAGRSSGWVKLDFSSERLTNKRRKFQ